MPTAQQEVFEYLALGLESTYGTAITTPTHYITAKGMGESDIKDDVPSESRGTRAKNYRRAITAREGKWSAQGGMDSDLMPLLAKMGIMGALPNPTTPGGTTQPRLWTGTREMLALQLKSATLFYGDPNVQIFRGAYGMLNSLKITANVPGAKITTISYDGFMKFPEEVAAPTLPAQTAGPLFVPADMEVWLDTGATAIGTTPITARIFAVEHDIPTGIEPDMTASGPTGDRTFNRVNVAEVAPTTTITLAFDDLAEYTKWKNGTPVKLRVRHNGPVIETVASVDYRHYSQFDLYGPLRKATWGTQKGARTLKLTVDGFYEPTIGSDMAFAFQNTKSTI